MRLARFKVVLDVVGDGTTEDDDVQQRVGSKTVGSMNRDGSSFASCIETWNNGVLAVLCNQDVLS